MIGIPLGLLAGNAAEWVMHKYVLHEMGREPDSFWGFHFHEHHRLVRQNGFKDPMYDERFPLGFHAQGKESWALIGASVAVAPLFPVAPFFTATLWYCAINYYRTHKHAHDNPQWARENLQWHYDHHMGRNPGANWCISKPWFDYIMGTRVYTEGCPRETNPLGWKKMPKWMEKRLFPGFGKQHKQQPQTA